MLQSITTFDNDTRFKNIFSGRNWCAICPETGAFLSAGRGRSKVGNSHKYVLIVPNESLEDRGGYFGRYTWDNPRRKFIRAWSDDEAIELANKKLSKILEKVIK